MSLRVALPFRIRSVVEIIKVLGNISSTSLDQGKIGLLEEANEVIEAPCIGVNRFWGLLHLTQKEKPLSCMLLCGNAMEELPGTQCHALQDGEDGDKTFVLYHLL